jgi:FAD/FMN-containing dehydrogenase/Fe-S oxidoreductase
LLKYDTSKSLFHQLSFLIRHSVFIVHHFFMPRLDPQRERLQEDLRGLISGSVRCDDLFLQLHASDASIYEIRPQAVVSPLHAADVAACVRYAREKKLSIHARGAGGGVAGESLGTGIILDFSKYLRRIVRFDNDKVRVQPGIALERFSTQLGEKGRLFGPEPSHAEVTTVGGLLARDSAGSRWLKYGSAQDHVLGMQVVLADGEILDFGREPLEDGGSVSTIPRKKELIDRLAALLRDRAAVIAGHQLKSPLKRCGYNLDGVLGENYLDVARLLVGSEGTLALSTEATLSTQPLPGPRGVTLLLFESLEKAARTVPDILAWKPTACELMDRRHLSLARDSEVRFDLLVPAEAEAVLLVEQECTDSLELHDHLRMLSADICQDRRLAFGARQAFEPEETELFWHLVDGVRPAMYRLKGPERPLPLIDDLTAPPEVLPDFLVRIQNVLKKHQVTASLFAHAGQGQIHLRPFLNLHHPEDVERMQRMAEEIYQEAFDAGGSIAGEHGYGLSRTEFLRRQAGPLYEIFEEVKRIFDPENLFNPGKIVSDGTSTIARNLLPPLRSSPSEPGVAEPVTASVASQSPQQMRSLVELQLDWEPAKVLDAVEACNRCGLCRTQAPGKRMCPIFRMAPSEEASPRAKANLIRGALSGAVDLNQLTSVEFKDLADLCVHCHSCRLECPAAVDISRIMRESKGAYVAANGLKVSQWAMTRLDMLAALASLISPVANWAIGNRQMRWIMEKTLGIAQGRKLPRVNSRNFMRRAARRRLTRPVRRSGQKVLYFVDLYANYFDPQLADCLVAVFGHNGLGVYVHPDQKPAGMPSIALGALDHARLLAQHNVRILAEAVRQGYSIVASEPSAALCLKHEYPQLLDDDDAKLVAENSSEACSFLWKMHTMGKLQLDFKPLHATLGYHTPCHLNALQVGTPGKNLLGLIPGLRIHHLEEGCSGMAGTYGLLNKNYRHSLRGGLRLINRMRKPAIQAGTTECSTCKIQMEQGTSKPTIHPLKLLALSYSLMPELARLLTKPGEELIVT